MQSPLPIGNLARAEGERGSARGWVGLAVFLVGYGNGTALLRTNATPEGAWPGVALGLLLMGIVAVWARRVLGLSWYELGLGRQGAGRSAGLGLLVALIAGLLSLGFLNFPLLPGGPVRYAPLESASYGALLLQAFVWIPLDIALPEELAFRGVLLAIFRRRYSDPWAVGLSAGVFTLWHGVVTTGTVALTSLSDDPLLFALGLIGAFGAIFVGGVLFAALRLWTGHLAASVVAHWAFNATLLLGLPLLGRLALDG